MTVVYALAIACPIVTALLALAVAANDDLAAENRRLRALHHPSTRPTRKARQ